MASGFLSNGVDLDLIFQPRGSATPVANTGYNVAGIDLAQRYAPRTTPPVPVTGFKSAGVDLNQIFNGLTGPSISYRFVNPGSFAIFKESSTQFGASPSILLPTGFITLAFSAPAIVVGDYAYPGGLRATNLSSDSTGITYIGGIDIPSTTRNNIDTLWNDLSAGSIPGVGVGMASGSFDIFDNTSPPLVAQTLSAVCTGSNVSMVSFVNFLLAQPLIYVASFDNTGALLGYANPTPGDEASLWATITAQAKAAGLYAGSHEVMIAPVSDGVTGSITPAGTNFTGSSSFYTFFTTSNPAYSPQSLYYTSPSMLIERF